MKKLTAFLPLLATALLVLCPTSRALDSAATPAPAAAVKAEPSLEQRVADLENMVNNAPRGSDAPAAVVSSKISGPAPGHNAWMMSPPRWCSS